jgi:adenylyltransferase/sulfurtransferase
MHITEGAVAITTDDLEEGRFSRFDLIDWWDQRKLADARVLVVGAGAIGNEVLKNLALLGVGNILIVDLDTIENSNLSRSVLYRPCDIGSDKAEVAAERTREIFDGCRVHAVNANVLHDIGLGVFGWSDVILGALDNREARLFINRAAWKMNRPWIDGAIEGINGVARVFLPGQAPCYECTLGEMDWKILEKRMSCNLLTREEMETGKTPTTPTTSSVIAGIQVQEALKLLHGMPVLAGKGFVFEGMNHSSYVTEYTPRDDCYSHEVYDRVRVWPGASTNTTIADLHSYAKYLLKSDEIVLEFSREVIRALRCPKCSETTEVFACVGSLSSSDGLCPRDGDMREVVTAYSFDGSEDYGDTTIQEMGLPPHDVFVARSATQQIQLVIEGDRAAALGPLATDKDNDHG